MEVIREFLMTEVGLSQSTQHKLLVTLLILLFLGFIRITLLRIVWNRTKEVKL